MKKVTLEVNDPFPQVAPRRPSVYVLTDTRHQAYLLMYARHNLIESSPEPQDLCMYYPHFPVRRGSEKGSRLYSLLVSGLQLRAFPKEPMSNSSPSSLTPVLASPSTAKCLTPHLTDIGLK